MHRALAFLIWMAVAVPIGVAISLAASSPLLAFRQSVYILGSLAGVVALALLLLQPLLAAGSLPGLSPLRSRMLHRWIGTALVLAVLIHVSALWVTSPPDVIDALLFRSPTWFSIWGVIAMWSIFASFLLIKLRRSAGFRSLALQTGHKWLAVVITTGTALHALLIEGTMETVSKWMLCALVLIATGLAIIYRRRRSSAA